MHFVMKDGFSMTNFCPVNLSCRQAVEVSFVSLSKNLIFIKHKFKAWKG